MRVRWFSNKVVAVGLMLAAGATWGADDANARSRATSSHGAGHGAHGKVYAGRGGSVARYAYRGGGLQCVPFARENTGIELAGNAATWWSSAEGLYERGARPEVGSILNFRANGRMRMGHVAVVSNVVNSRSIEIDHANWAGPGGGRGAISRNITVVDVSPGNDWTAVRVALGHTDDFGSIYPTYGFIYDRPDHGVMVANTGTAPVMAMNTPPRDLRPMAERGDAEEVAEAADDVVPTYRRSSTRRGGHAGPALRTVSSHGTVVHGKLTQAKGAPLHGHAGKASVTKVQTRTPSAAPTHRAGKRRT